MPFCYTFPEEGIYNICVTGSLNETFLTCCSEVNIEPICCPDSFLNYQIVDCPLVTELNFNFDSLEIVDTNSIVSIDLGDGTIISSSFQETFQHSYDNPGIYEVCITYLVDSIHTLTCCETINVDLPSECDCPPNILDTEVMIEQVADTCQYKVTACLNEYSPCDSTTHIWAPVGELVEINDSCATFEFPEPGYYDICMTCAPLGDSLITCCEQVYIPEFCLNPYFTLDEQPGSESCIKPLFCINSVDCPFSNHTWYFPDGTVSYDFIPDPQCINFTDFVTETGEVCVKHVVEYCGEKDSLTVCVQVEPGAYLGNPGTTWRLSDTMPLGVTVLEFIEQHQAQLYPLFIEGELIIDIDHVFSDGIWNMGRDAQITVEGTNFLPRKEFGLRFMNIQGAKRLDEKYSCCRWNGIVSNDLTDLDWKHSWISDAKIGLHYPRETIGSLELPIIRFDYVNFIGNWFGIKSMNQEVFFEKFDDNAFDGASHSPEVCDCNAVNAIDFRNGTSRTKSLEMPYVQDYNNRIKNYEQGIHLLNFSAKLSNFKMKALDNYQPVQFFDNGYDDPGIGVDYEFNNSLNSDLTMDFMKFEDFINPIYGSADTARSLAVHHKITNGRHTLKAIGSEGKTIIVTGLLRGYRMEHSSSYPLNAEIAENQMQIGQVDKPSYGILADFTGTSQNKLHIHHNLINTTSQGLGSLTNWNGGIGLIGFGQAQQNLLIEDNEITVLNPNNSQISNVGIMVSECAKSIIRNNLIDNGSANNGIILQFAPNTSVRCNDIKHCENGILAMTSKNSNYLKNDLYRNKYDLHWYGDNRVSSVQANAFDGSEFSSVLFNVDGEVGAQTHAYYNSWLVQNGVELKHENQDQAVNRRNRYWYPEGQPQGGINHPEHEVDPYIMEDVPYLPIIFDTDVCAEGGGSNTSSSLTYPDRLASLQTMVEDMSEQMLNLPLALRTGLAQSIYGEFLDEPQLFVDIPGLLTAMEPYVDMKYVQTSQLLYQQLRDKKEAMAAQFVNLEGDISNLQSLQATYSGLIQAAQQASSDQEREDLLVQATQIKSAMVPLEDAIHQSWQNLYQANNQDILILLTDNEKINGGTEFAAKEKAVQELILKTMLNIPMSTTEEENLRSIAQTCYEEGGRAVFMAQALTVALLQEKYELSECTGAKPLAGSEEKESQQRLLVAPNPAHSSFTISWDATLQESLEVEVYNLMGKKQYSGKGQYGQLTLQTSNWTPGMYLVKAKNLPGMPVVKVLVQNN